MHLVNVDQQHLAVDAMKHLRNRVVIRSNPGQPVTLQLLTSLKEAGWTVISGDYDSLLVVDESGNPMTPDQLEGLVVIDKSVKVMTSGIIEYQYQDTDLFSAVMASKHRHYYSSRTVLSSKSRSERVPHRLRSGEGNRKGPMG
jgi:hypothetical protein